MSSIREILQPKDVPDCDKKITSGQSQSVTPTISKALGWSHRSRANIMESSTMDRNVEMTCEWPHGKRGAQSILYPFSQIHFATSLAENVLGRSPKWTSHFTVSLSRWAQKSFLSLGLGPTQLTFQIWKTGANFKLSLGECEFPFELLLYPKSLYKYICGDATSSWAVKCRKVQLLSARDSLDNLACVFDFFNLYNRLHLDPLFRLWGDNRGSM